MENIFPPSKLLKGVVKLVMRRKWCFMVMIIMFWVNASYVLAGDAFDSISSNREPQDALLIGKVVNNHRKGRGFL